MQLPLLPTSLAVLSLLFLNAVPAAQAGDLTSNAFFKALNGNWNGQGKLINDVGETYLATNQIKAHFSEDGALFVIEGKLQVEDNEVPYRWEYMTHSIEGLYAARFIDLNGKQSDFDATVDTANMRAKVTQTSGSSAESRIEMESRVENEKYYITFRIIDSAGKTNLEGSLQFDRE